MFSARGPGIVAQAFKPKKVTAAMNNAPLFINALGRLIIELISQPNSTNTVSRYGECYKLFDYVARNFSEIASLRSQRQSPSPPPSPSRGEGISILLPPGERG